MLVCDEHRPLLVTDTHMQVSGKTGICQLLKIQDLKLGLKQGLGPVQVVLLISFRNQNQTDALGTIT